MKTATMYKNIILEWFYYNKEDGTVRRAKDGYHGKYHKDDIVKPFKLCSHGYGGVHLPTTRTTIPYHHLVAVLNGINISENTVVDHLDGNKNNNAVSNLRIVSQQLNCKNKLKRKDNTSGYTGINKNGNLYIVRKQIDGKRVYFGCRKTLEDAIKLMESKEALITSNGYTERHGK